MIETAFIIALCVLFIHATTWEGMINEWAAKAGHNLPSWIKKPLYDCPICMAPWWGFGIYTVLGVFDLVPYLPLPALIIVLFAAGGINAVLIYIISADREVTKELKESGDAE